MPTVPEGVNRRTVLQGTVRKYYNRLVKEWFSDADAADLIDLEIPRHAAYLACLHHSQDSLIQTVCKQLLFDKITDRFQPNLVGEASQSATVLRKQKVKVTLYFEEYRVDVEDGYAPIEGTIGFRLMDEGISVTESTLKSIANGIKAQFKGESSGRWKRGKVMATYTNWEQGYQLQLLCRDESEGKSLVNRVLGIRGHNPDWSLFQIKTNELPAMAYPTLPESEAILGEITRLPRRRPIATVHFHSAVAKIPGKANAVVLLDRSGRYPDPLVDW